jgi:hypothetical protein
MDGERSVQRGAQKENHRKCTASSWKRSWQFVLRAKWIATAALSCMLFAPNPSYADRTTGRDEPVVQALAGLGKNGDAIARARDQVLDILQQNNACTAWFQESDPDAAEVFRSLHFEVEASGTSYVYGMRDPNRGLLLKHPWAAKAFQNAGRNSTILLNAHGPFFNHSSMVMQLESGGTIARPTGNLVLTIFPYTGNSPGAQIVILLHELGHIIGRLPSDDDSWDGRSARNTAEVLRHCKAETNAAVHNNLRSSN